MASTKLPSHPKGHKVKTLREIWDYMDPEKNKQYLRLTDTASLSDVWVQPKTVARTSPLYLDVTFAQIVSAPHMHIRDVKYQISADDLLKMFYLADIYAITATCGSKCDFDAWLTEKVNKRNSAHGLEGAEDRALLCEFIFNEDETFSLFPIPDCASMAMFFRKICYHSYKSEEDKSEKAENPSMMKCHAARAKFEYMYEAKIFLLPEKWVGGK